MPANHSEMKRRFKLPWQVTEDVAASTPLQLPPDHFLSQPLPNFALLKVDDWRDGALDTSSLSAADFGKSHQRADLVPD
jgi:hypothetical protein